MKNVLNLFVAAVGLAASLVGTAYAEDADKNVDASKTTRILFIGNSYTYVNSLDEMVDAMMNAAGYPTKAERCVLGGWRLRQHFNGIVPEKYPNYVPAPQRIKEQQWDYVVMQEQSCGAVDQRAEFLEFGKKLNDMILENCVATKVLLYQTWGRCDGMFEGYGDDENRKAEVLAAFEKRYSAPNEATIEALKDGMQGGYVALAKLTGATVAPVGKAFKEVGDKVDLYAAEGAAKPHHPSRAGTYLGACVFFKTITGESPKGMWKKLNDAKKDFKVSEEDAAYLEGVADEIVDKNN